MIDNENTEGGFRHHLFCSVTNSKGERYWYSPILGRICQDVAAMPQGGILGKIQQQERNENVTKRKIKGKSTLVGVMMGPTVPTSS